MPQSLLDALTRLARAKGYRDPALILTQSRARERRQLWWVVK